MRDKDGISAALRVAELAAALQGRRARRCSTRLDELAAEYGRYATDQVSIRVDDLSIIDDTMRRLRATPPPTLLGAPVAVEDLLPDADVLRWRVPGGRVVVRPSGTEPKLKAYLEVVEPSGSADAAARTLAPAARRGRSARHVTLMPPTTKRSCAVTCPPVEATTVMTPRRSERTATVHGIVAPAGGHRRSAAVTPASSVRSVTAMFSSTPVI